MTKKNTLLRKTFVITLILVIFVCFYMAIVSKSINKSTISRIKNENEWKVLLNNNLEEFTRTAQDFNKQNNIYLVQYQRGYNETSCDQNDFNLCTSYAVDASYDIYKKGVLLDNRNEFAQMMKKYKIMFLIKSSFHGSNIEFSSGDFGKCGLKYFANDTDFKTDDNFLVKKIDNNWFYFCEDWN